MELKIIPSDLPKPKPHDEASLGFGDIFSDHMFIMFYEEGKGWYDACIRPYDKVELEPAAMVLHYAQAIFEGLKAYRRKDGGINLFRPWDNLKRFNRSARRMCMPEIDEGFVLHCMKQLIIMDKDWVPKNEGTSLYIRPTMFATEPHLGVRPSKTYIFFIITGPVGAYYREGFNPVKIYVEDYYVRSAPGGTGDVKTGGNYAASLFSSEAAKAKGFTQVLWLDAVEHRYIEEVGTMNVLFLIDDELVTPPLTGSILPGITRDSVMQIARDWGMKVVERRISIDEVIEAAQDGRLKEAFGTGTATVISPIGQITYKDKSYVIADGRMGELSKRLYDEIVEIQYGYKQDPYGWIERVC